MLDIIINNILMEYSQDVNMLINMLNDTYNSDLKAHN